ncbi:MAG: adenylate kinase family protein [Nanoarchaeota archaeon]
MRVVILVSGTPGTGKTVVAKFLAKILPATYIDINSLIKKQKIYSSYDKKLKTYLVDVEQLIPVLRKVIKKNNRSFVIDGHLSHYFPKTYATFCIVTKCAIPVLQKRLRQRGYSKKKIAENVQAELFDVCLVDAATRGHRIRIVDTTKGIKHLDVKKLLR